MDIIRRGFTIIELAIAIAVVILVLAVSIPRYTSYVRQQDFAASVQDVVRCVQSAQQIAATPKMDDQAKIRYSSVTIQQQATDTLSCVVQTYPGFTNTGTPVSLSMLQGNQTLLNSSVTATTQSTYSFKGIQLNSVTSSGKTAQNVMPAYGFKLYFGLTEKGVPLVSCVNTGEDTPAFPECKNSDSAQLSGDGFPSILEVEDTNSAKTIKGQIKINSLGNPITYEAIQ